MTEPFISRQDLTDYLGRDVTSDDGALIAINAASDMCRTFSEQEFTPVTGDTVALDGSGTDCVLLPERPVNTVGTVVVNGVTKGTLDYVSTTDGKLFATSGTADWTTWSNEFTTGSCWIRGGTAIWPAGRQNIVVTYDHGYETGGSADVPRDVRMVALAIASRLFVQTVAAAETLGPASVRYHTAPPDLTAGEQMILRKYRTT